MRPTRWIAILLAACLLASMLTMGLAEEVSSEAPVEATIGEAVEAPVEIPADEGAAIAAEPVEAEAPVELGETDLPVEEPAAQEPVVEEALPADEGYAVAAAPLPEYTYAQVASDGAAVYRQGDDWEPAATLSADDVVLMTGMNDGRAAIAFCADGEVFVGTMELSELLPLNEERTSAYLDQVAVSGTAGLYNGDLNWPLMPLANVTYGDGREVLASSNYTDINNDTVFNMNGKDIYANMVPDTGSGNCWRWAQGIYELVWGCRFSENFKGNDNTGLNLLANLNDAQRTLTPAHLKAFIGQTTPGATIRMCACSSECSSFNNDGLSCGHKGHSMIVVGKNADGLYTMDSHSNSQHTRFYSWQGFCNAWKGYTYVKYIKWPGVSPLPANSISADGANIAVNGVSLSTAAFTMNVGETTSVVAIISPADATDKSVTWATSDASVVVVNDGAVTALKAGAATVGVRTTDGNFTATCTVTVKKPIERKALTKKGSNGTVFLALGEQLQLTPDFAVANGWQVKGVKSSKAKVASVDASGLITGLTVGKAKITVSTSKKKATLNVAVVDPSMPAAVALNKSGTQRLKVGDTLKLEAAVLPTTASTTFAWKSSKPSVAAVDGNGNVICLKKGSATIAVRTANGKTAKVKIKVSKK